MSLAPVQATRPTALTNTTTQPTALQQKQESTPRLTADQNAIKNSLVGSATKSVAIAATAGAVTTFASSLVMTKLAAGVVGNTGSVLGDVLLGTLAVGGAITVAPVTGGALSGYLASKNAPNMLQGTLRGAAAGAVGGAASNILLFKSSAFNTSVGQQFLVGATVVGGVVGGVTGAITQAVKK